MEKIRPMLFTTLKKYSGAQLMSDVVAGIIVAIIALPLSIALALASGVGPEQGIYTAIAAGFVISFLGGSQVQIAGPTAAFATIVAGIVAKSGVEGLAVATIMAGIILVVMGFCHFGSLIKFIPFTITTGFTSGIAVTIVIGQLKDFFGVTYPAGMETIETMQKLKAFAAGFGSVNLHAIIVGVVCLAILIVMPMITEKIPGSLVAVIAGILMVKFLPLHVNTIGDLYTVSNKLPAFRLPVFSYDVIQGSLSDAFTIAVLAAIESLLSCVVADGMIGGKHRSNTELVAQGAGNIISALFGGIPATGAIARTAANVKNGGRTPVAGMVHAVVLLLILVVLMPCASWIPMPTIAAILFMVAYNMCQWRTFVRLTKTAPKSDIAVLVLTFFLTVIFDLVVAIEIGMLLSCLLFMKRMSDETGVRSWLYVEEVEEQKRAVAKHQAVGGGAVVVGGGEALVVKPSRAAGGDDHHLGPGHQVLAGLHVLEHSARNLALVVQDQLDGGGKVHHCDAAVDHLVPQHAHDLSAGVVRAGVHTLSGGAAAVGGHHGAVWVFIEHNA